MNSAALRREAKAALRRMGGAAVLFLDFDGTLAPIVRDRAGAYPSRETLSALRLLCMRPRLRVFVVSGRSRADLRRRLPCKGLVLLGDHGFDAGRLSGRTPSGWPRIRRLLRRELGAVLALFEEASLEVKPVTMTLHFRAVPNGRIASLLRRVRDRVRNLLRKGSFRLRPGRKALEFLPSGRWGKGALVQRVFLEGGERRIAIVLGDDRTDEEIFRHLPHEITVRVGPGKTAARFRLSGPGSASRFLRWLAQAT